MSSTFLIRICTLAATAVLTLSTASAQNSSAKLDIAMLPGLTITGAVGTVYSVQYVTDLSKSNDWLCLDFIRLQAPSALWIDSTASGAPRRYYRAVADARTNMVFIPPGTFRMGSPSNELDRLADEGPQTEVTLTKGFYMGSFKVTQAEYLWVTGQSPSVFPGDLNRPVESIDWTDATNYCALLTQRDRASKIIPHNCIYRLPTEAEWEYACRALTSTRFSYGDDPTYASLADYGWYEVNSDNVTHAVGQKLPNLWGLYDMHGGLWEWCLDWYGPYPGGRVVDPQGSATGTYRVFRGGSWGCRPGELRSASRDYNPEGETGYVGFRVVLVPAE